MFNNKVSIFSLTVPAKDPSMEVCITCTFFNYHIPIHVLGYLGVRKFGEIAKKGCLNFGESLILGDSLTVLAYNDKI